MSASNIPCLVCNTLVFDTDDNQSLSLSSSSSYSEDKRRNTLFLLRNLLEIPKPYTNSGEDESKVDNGQCLRFVVTCDQCKETIKQARLIYSQIRELAQKFRGVQKKIVEALKNQTSTTTTGDPGVFTKNVDHYRKLVNDWDFNGFGFPFVVHEDDEDEEVPKANEDDLDSSKIQPSPVSVVVKEEQEQVEEENTVTSNQNILLIFPEVEEEETNNNDEEETSQMDSEEDEEDDEKDSDFHCSEVDSAEEKNVDNVHQINEQNSEDEDDEQVNSRPRRPRKRRLVEKPWSKPSNPYPCPLCHHTLKTMSTLRVHLKRSHPGNSVSLKEIDRGQPPKNPPEKKINGRPCNPDNPFPCPLCPSRSKYFSNLKSHLKKAHPNNQIILDDLRLKFYPPLPPLTEPSLPEDRNSSKPRYTPISSFRRKYPHIICKRNSQGKFPCPWTEPSPCSKIYTMKSQLQKHITVLHLKLPMFTCSWSGDGEGGQGQVCGKTFSKRSNYLEHYDRHRGTPGYKCEDCGMTFYRRNDFNRHTQKMHLNEKYICEICGRGFACQEYLYQHRYGVHMGRGSKNQQNEKEGGGGGGDPPGIICDLCGKMLSNKLTLKQHVEAIHEKVPGKYCCHLCDKRFRGSTHLNLHLWNKHGHKVEGYEPKEKIAGAGAEVVRKYSCHLCDKRFSVITYLNMHLWEKHQFKAEGYEPKEKVARKDRFQCGVKGCKKPFLKKENLEKHKIEVHGEDGSKKGPWNCKYCGKNFFWKEKWEHCERTHENKESRPEKCEVCGKGFPTQHHLKFHLRHTHKMQLEDNRGWKGKI